jgi:glycosyltransferase involved in cell wall biosynthesis
MNTPLISICIPAYNGQKFLETCLDSAICQTYRNIEIIVVDDYSADKTYEIAKSYATKDSRVKLYRNDKNLGLVDNWNKCLELVTGTWIKFLFQDDYLDTNCVEQMLSDASDTDKIIASKRKFIFDSDTALSKKKYYENELIAFERLGMKSGSTVFINPKQVSLMAVENICLNFIGEPTVIMFKRDVINEIGIFNKDLTQLCDLEYFLRIATKYGIKYIPMPLACFRIHNDSTTSTNISTRLFAVNHLETLVTTHQLLFAPVFTAFRSSLSVFKSIRLKLYFKTHVYEAMLAASGLAENNMEKFEEICKKYAEVEKHRNGSILIRFVFFVVRRRRNK